MQIKNHTAHELHRLASVSLNAAEANLLRAEKAVAAARNAKEVADAIYEAAITEQAVAHVEQLNGSKLTGDDVAMLRDLLRVGAIGDGDHAALTRLLNAYETITAKA